MSLVELSNEVVETIEDGIVVGRGCYLQGRFDVRWNAVGTIATDKDTYVIDTEGL